MPYFAQRATKGYFACRIAIFYGSTEIVVPCTSKLRFDGAK